MHNLTETAVQFVVSFKLQPQKRCASFIDTRLRAGTRTRFLNLPWVIARGKEPHSAGVTDPEEAASSLRHVPLPGLLL